jgi:hypothetical protein
VSSLVALAIGGGLGYVCWRYKKISFVSLGIVSGFFIGSFIYTICLAFGWESIWGMFILSILAAIGGGVLALYFPIFTVDILTSGIGSYIFMRGWANIFGGYPSESQILSDIQNGDSPDLTWALWIYLAVFILSWVGSYWWCVSKEEHPKYDNNFVRQE